MDQKSSTGQTFYEKGDSKLFFNEDTQNNQWEADLNDAYTTQGNFQDRLGFLQELLNFERIPIVLESIPREIFVN